MHPLESHDKIAEVTKYKRLIQRVRTEFKKKWQENPKCPELNITENFKDFVFLGGGAFGDVYCAHYKTDGQAVAIKIQSKRDVLEANKVAEIIQERKFLSAMENIFICKIIGKWKDHAFLFMVLEFAFYGDLTRYQIASGTLNEDQSRIFVSQIVGALEYVHACNIIYRDLKQENCLIYEGFRLKLGDFGLSILSTSPEREFLGTPCFCAPEMYGLEKYTDAIDWWALGMVLYQLLHRKLPFGMGGREDENTAFLKLNMDLEFDDGLDLSREVKDLLQRLLEKNPSKRIGSGLMGSTMVKNHAWFRTTDWYNMIYARVLMTDDFAPGQRPMCPTLPIEYPEEHLDVASQKAFEEF